MNLETLPEYVNPTSRNKYSELANAIQRNKEATAILKSFTENEKKELKTKFNKFSPDNITANINPFYIKMIHAYDFISSYVFVDIGGELKNKIIDLRNKLYDLSYTHELMVRCNGAVMVKYYHYLQSICEPYSTAIYELVNLYDACYSKEEVLDNFSLNDLNLEDDKKEIVLFDKDNPVVKE
jgi:hypothetical protein